MKRNKFKATVIKIKSKKKGRPDHPACPPAIQPSVGPHPTAGGLGLALPAPVGPRARLSCLPP
jgi:hypothetical protein